VSNDEIIWDAPTPPPKNWYVRHKAGEALEDKEAAVRSAVDDIEREEVYSEMYSDYEMAESNFEKYGGKEVDYEGVVNKVRESTKKYTGGSIVDLGALPDYSAYSEGL